MKVSGLELADVIEPGDVILSGDHFRALLADQARLRQIMEVLGPAVAELKALKASIAGLDPTNTNPNDVAHTLYNLENDAQLILNRLAVLERPCSDQCARMTTRPTFRWRDTGTTDWGFVSRLSGLGLVLWVGTHATGPGIGVFIGSIGLTMFSIVLIGAEIVEKLRQEIAPTDDRAPLGED